MSVETNTRPVNRVFQPGSSIFLDEDERSYLRALGEEKSYGAGSEAADYTFEACPVCALPTYISTKQKGTGKTELVYAANPCSSCSQFVAEHPRFYSFIVAVVRGREFFKRKLEKVGVL